ncbi:MAG TPA: tetratricopeptide repeat protein [Tepidisphaeraceae bacterium]|nr:tetratricopeptide repeat protein [Tepidisphaeraceae bacterium]
MAEFTIGQAHALAAQYLTAGKAHEAGDLYRQILDRQPSDPWAMLGFGRALEASGQLDAALEHFHKALPQHRQLPELFEAIGRAWIARGHLDAAEAAFREFAVLRPDDANAHNALGATLWQKRHIDAAIAELRLAIQLRPNFPEALSNLASALRHVGRLNEALQCYQTALKLGHHQNIASNLLYLLYYLPGWPSAQIAQAHEQWSRVYAQPLAAAQDWSNTRDSKRRLRIGYVSPDFKEHCQSFFTLPLLSHHDHGQFEIFCYSSVPSPDAITNRLRAQADVWRDAAHLGDEQLAAVILQDQIDILVDLTMHMAGGRPLLFARRPAPIQVAYLAYPGTTGLTAIQYRFTDSYLEPAGAAPFGPEDRVALPDAFWCYDPLTNGPEISPLPAASAGNITFGCLNNTAKVNQQTLELWVKVLAALPTARLILLMSAGSARARIVSFFEQQSIASHRIEFVDHQPREKYLEQYQRFDIALDTIPYNGHTTTLDALWMGVPVVSLVGQTVVGRGGLSILSNVGLSNLVAQSQEQFVQICKTLGTELPALQQLRNALRSRLHQSPLMDAQHFTRNIESAYRRMFQKWCDAQ